MFRQEPQNLERYYNVLLNSLFCTHILIIFILNLILTNLAL